MPFPFMAAAMGASSLASYFGSKEQASAQEAANQANLQLGREQMNFQERMSSTAHQREVADLKAAGLNPMLSVNGGASSPSGSLPTMQPVPSQMAAVASSARDSIRLLQDIKESNSRVMLNTESASTKWTEGQRNYTMNKLLEQNEATAKMQNSLLSSELSMFSKSPRLFSLLKILRDRGIDLNSATNAVKSMTSLMPY